LSKKEYETENKIARQLALQFWAAALVFLALTFVFCLAAVWFCRNQVFWDGQADTETAVLCDGANSMLVGTASGYVLPPYGALLYWIFTTGLLLFVFTLFVIAMLQRRKLIFYLASLSDEISEIGEEREEGTLPGILEDAQKAIWRLEEKFRKMDYAIRETKQWKNDFVVNLAHDLKTPLASSIGYLTLLQNEKQISPDKYRYYVDIVMNNTKRLDMLFNDLFELMRFNMSQITLNYDTANLAWLMEQLVYEFKPMLVSKKLSCRLDIPSDVMVQCDVDKMGRVMENLLRNAINYSYCDTEISILVTVENRIRIVFMNYGKHISSEQLKHIFERFYRLDKPGTAGAGGFGLGLAIAREIVELHQGTIGAECSGEEIRFTVLLPLCKEKEEISS